MIFRNHYSSSAGNLYEVVAANGRRLLLECGVVWAKLQQALDFNLGGIEGVFVSHLHQDHCKAIRDVTKAGIDVYASPETFEALGVAGRRYIPIKDTEILHTDSFGIMPFSVEHNCPGPFGYVIREKETREYMLFAVDTAYIKQVFPFDFSVIAIGCNFDTELLEKRVESGDMNEAVAKRILTSHPSSWWVKKYLTESIVHDKLREIHLLHCSGGNLDKDKARKQIAEAIPFVKVY